MKNDRYEILVEQNLDLNVKALGVLYRDGWSCEQIHTILKNAEINNQNLLAMQARDQAIAKLERGLEPLNKHVSVVPESSFYADIDFLNRGPEAAASVLLAKGWTSHEVSLVVKESLFIPLLNEAQVKLQSNRRANAGDSGVTFLTKAENKQTTSSYPNSETTVQHFPKQLLRYPDRKLYHYRRRKHNALISLFKLMAALPKRESLVALLFCHVGLWIVAFQNDIKKAEIPESEQSLAIGQSDQESTATSVGPTLPLPISGPNLMPRFSEKTNLLPVAEESGDKAS
ncbi:MAG: hypothetical protein AAF579_14660 [Cyanobacteria bacterium P01_C01_bin.118]